MKGIWKHIKAHDLQNPQDKRQIICDEPLKAIFKKDNVHMFTMVSVTPAIPTRELTRAVEQDTVQSPYTRGRLNWR